MMRVLQKNFWIIFLAIVTILLSACFQNREKLPWSQEKTIAFFTEVQLIESELSFQGKNQQKDSLSKIYYQALFEKFGTNQTEFETILKYYTEHPDEMENIYSEVITKLMLIQSNLQ